MEQNTPQSQIAVGNTGKNIGIIALVCFIVSLICVFALPPGIGLTAGFLLLLVALVLSIVAVVKGGKVVGIITLCLVVLVGGPLGLIKSCAVGFETLNDPAFQNKLKEDPAVKKQIENLQAVQAAAVADAMSDPAVAEKMQEAQAQAAAMMEDPAVKKQMELAAELQKAMMANDTEKVQAIQKEMEENAAKISQ